jgi:hypothetical protein
MKDFNLKDALAGKPVITRDGRPVKIAGYNPDAIESARIIGWVKGSNFNWYEGGKFMGDAVTNADLFMAPSERKEWVLRVGVRLVWVYTDKAEAILQCEKWKNAGSNATIHEITIHE